MTVVADTSVVGYLILIGQSHLLPQLFSSVVIPEEVREKLAHGSALEAPPLTNFRASPRLLRSLLENDRVP